MRPAGLLLVLFVARLAEADPLWLGIVNETGTLLPLATYSSGRITPVWREPVPAEFFKPARMRRVPKDWLGNQGELPVAWEAAPAGPDPARLFEWSGLAPYQAACRKGWGLETPLGEHTRPQVALSPSAPFLRPMTDRERRDAKGLEPAVLKAWESAARTIARAGTGTVPSGKPTVQAFAMPSAQDRPKIYYVEIYPPPLGLRGRPAWWGWAVQQGDKFRLDEARTAPTAGAYRLALGFVRTEEGAIAVFENGDFGKLTYTVERITLAPLAVRKEREFSGGGC